jgi:hypothetical protein
VPTGSRRRARVASDPALGALARRRRRSRARHHAPARFESRLAPHGGSCQRERGAVRPSRPAAAVGALARRRPRRGRRALSHNSSLSSPASRGRVVAGVRSTRNTHGSKAAM